ncbi:MAG: xanthine dehydrogenase family protein molybdopterin-binding subunit [Rhodocyclaceae bacterium]|jgi:isoquinoline 1-oxidoreductase beta subunit|nr:xanthine dehydrogenase family protein molybdopterin-binding subunit [Rhodocyclaceae bacterium]
MNNTIVNESRRRFLQGSAGLTLAVYLAPPAQAAAGKTAPRSFEPNAFLRIGSDNSVTVISKHLEMGQGTYTGLATIVAEELDAAWSQVRVEGAPADAKRYNNLFFGPFQGTGGSTAMANSWQQLRQAGASARAMLVRAAARKWKVPEGEIQVADGVLSHPPSRRKAPFGELAVAASTEAVPETISLKDPGDFKLVGRRAPRKDAADKITGRARFTQDVQLPDMQVALVAHPPRFGAKVKGFDPAPALAIAGVTEVVAIPNGVAVLARDTWSALRGRDALQVEWDESAAFRLGSGEILERYRQLARKPGKPARSEGNISSALYSANQVLEASFDFPYLAHAAMEPMDCVVHVTPEGCEIWNGCQSQTQDQMKAAALLGLKPEQVRIHTLYAGGSFGRRANTQSDYVLEAASIAKASRHKGPIKLVWTREDDLRAGYFRPLFHHRLTAGLDAQGRPTAWHQRLVGQSIMAGSAFAAGIKNGIDPVSVEGAANLPYAIPNLQVELHTPEDIAVPVLWWRSVGSTHTAYAVEAFLDELAQAAGQDPVAYRLALLGDTHPRHAGVLRLAAEKAGWGSPLPPGPAGSRRGRGVALHESFNTYVAEVAEVTIGADGGLKVDRVVCAVDCGIAINPDNIRAQVEGSVAFALTAALHGAITLKDGVVEQSNFHDYRLLPIGDMPRVEVHIVASGEPPTGIGEPAVPPLAPAVANAIAAATGKRLYSLPFDTTRLTA